MKVKKSGFIVALCFGLAFLIAAAVLFLIPAAKTHIVVSEPIKVVMVNGSYEWRGKIQNTGDEDFELNRYNFSVTVKTSGGDNYYGSDFWFIDTNGKPTPVTLAPGEEYDLSTEIFMTDRDRTPSRVSQVCVEVDGIRYYLKGDPAQNSRRAVALLCILLALVFIIVAFANLKNEKNKAKRYDDFTNNVLSAIPDGGVIVNGFMANKGDGKKAAAKSALSVIGGALSAIFLGVGFYKIYSGSTPKEFILTDDNLYINDPKNRSTSLEVMTRLDGANFPEPTVAAAKKRVTVTSNDGAIVMTFPAVKGGVTVEELTAKLNKIFERREAHAAEPVFEEFPDTPAATEAPKADDGEQA